MASRNGFPPTRSYALKLTDADRAALKRLAKATGKSAHHLARSAIRALLASAPEALAANDSETTCNMHGGHATP